MVRNSIAIALALSLIPTNIARAYAPIEFGLGFQIFVLVLVIGYIAGAIAFVHFITKKWRKDTQEQSPFLSKMVPILLILALLIVGFSILFN